MLFAKPSPIEVTCICMSEFPWLRLSKFMIWKANSLKKEAKITENMKLAFTGFQVTLCRDVLNISELSGNFSIDDHLFQMGWNHQLEDVSKNWLRRDSTISWCQVTSGHVTPEKNREFMAIRLNSPLTQNAHVRLQLISFSGFWRLVK